MRYPWRAKRSEILSVWVVRWQLHNRFVGNIHQHFLINRLHPVRVNGVKCFKKKRARATAGFRKRARVDFSGSPTESCPPRTQRNFAAAKIEIADPQIHLPEVNTRFGDTRCGVDHFLTVVPGARFICRSRVI